MSDISFISKIIENMAVRMLVHHLNNNGLEEQYQSAYKAKHSTETALLKCQHDIDSALDDKCLLMLVMLYLST